MERSENATTQTIELGEGRDEMNLCEFPFGTLSKRPVRGKTLTYTDQVFDQAKQCHVERQWTIDGSNKFGLPTVAEDEVLLGLLQLTWKQSGFEKPRVRFSQRELLELIGWGTQGSDYQRLRRAFDCIFSTRIFCDRSWRDNSEKAYVSHAGLTLISNFELVDSRKANQTTQQAFEFANEQSLSWMEWGSEIFKSFQDGYLKKLDYYFVQSLKLPASKRLYRYLDKQFSPERGFGTISSELFVLAYEKLGVSRKADKRDIERIVVPAVTELETRGYLEEKPWEERLTKVRPKVYEVSFTVKAKAKKKKKKAELTFHSPLQGFGVSAKRAKELTDEFGLEAVTTQIEHLEFLLDSGRAPKDRGAWLVSAITGEWSLPDGFVSKAEREKKKLAIEEKRTRREREEREAQRRQEVELEKRSELANEALSKLSDAERERVFELALRKAPKLIRERYLRATAKSDSCSEDYRQLIFEHYFEKESATS